MDFGVSHHTREVLFFSKLVPEHEVYIVITFLSIKAML